ncbi:hypothetical protein KFE25_002329 [Diacronema lutheri]|uniref:Mg-protoporphyrin IX chelatase n=2 Tax=Diacronema lutheri TaxID=2081491 RepID=A0A8J5XLJ5_DIALT|nr:hypothetical protein KFE25_002329 [Diacronema lutheri]
MVARGALGVATFLALVAPGAGYAGGNAQPGVGARTSAIRRCGRARCVAAEPEAAAPVPTKKKFRVGPRRLPLSAIVGMDNVKTALLLAAVNPYIGGVVVAGSRGTAKSVMARAAHSLMPPIEIVKGSPYNIDPSGPSGEVDSFLSAELEATGKTLADLETEVIDVPFCQVPLDVLEDRLLGSVDLEKSLATGETIFEPGLLARAHRAVLYIDDINLLDEGVSNLLLSVISSGEVIVEREGLSVRYPCRPIMIATFNPEGGELRDHLLDRIGICLSADAEPLSLEQRIDAAEIATRFSTEPDVVEAEARETEEGMFETLVYARAFLRDVTISKAQITYLCEEAKRAGVQGHRAEMFATQVAKAAAAIEQRDKVVADDLTLAVKLAIIPRGTTVTDPNQPDDQMQQPPPPPPPQDSAEEEEDDESESEPESEEEEQDDAAPPVPEEFLLDADGTVLDPSVMAFAMKARTGRSGKGNLIFSEDRGRYIKPMLPKGKVRRLAVDATMRAAAPYQRGRRSRATESKPVYIEQSDVRAKKMARKAGSLIVFVVDASGSMALNRMNAAKGAAISLLTTAYQSRDKICLIAFQGEQATVLLPPTRSVAMAKNRLERMPCGGGSPLAHALNTAVQVGLQAQKSGDTGDVIVVCVSDGRANVPLATSLHIETPRAPGDESAGGEKADKEQLRQEVLQMAGMMRGLFGFKLLMLDTENKFVSTGMAKEIADAAGGRYHYIPKASEASMAAVANEALASLI